MKKKELLEKIATCSLMCHTCSAYVQWLKGNGEIKSLGIEGFLEKDCEKPHYKVYKD